MDPPAPSPDKVPVIIGVPIATRMASEISKPRDHQDFQRKCVVLFGAHLRDPHAQEYGRNGQKQRGVDIVLRQDGRADYRVGVQCRLVTEPLKLKKIETDCADALTFDDKLSEIIFATTAPDDTHATDAANDAERSLRAAGHDVRVVLYGWGQLQNLIARYDSAYALFCPSSVSTARSREALSDSDADVFAAAVVARMKTSATISRGLEVPGTPALPDGAREEDFALHGRIDALRDLCIRERQPQVAERGLLVLLELDGIETKPWARFRILSNLGNIAIMSGREDEAISSYELAFLLRPNNSGAKANLALVRILQERYSEAMLLAQEALAGEPRPDHAVSFLLQAAARSDWQGDPKDLVPPELAGTMHADLGLAEFYRRREVEGWQRLSIELGQRHSDVAEFKPIVAVAVLSLAIDSGKTISGGVGPVTAAELSNAAEAMLGYANEVLDLNFADVHDRVAHVSNACVLLRLCRRFQEAEALLLKAGALTRNEALLRRHMALVTAESGRREEATRLLDGDPDPENRLLRADLGAAYAPEQALEQALAVPGKELAPGIAFGRWFTIAEIAVRLGRQDELRSAVDGLRVIDPADPAADVFEARMQLRDGLPREEFQRRLVEIASGIAQDADMTLRHFVASELREGGLPDEASRVLEGHVDLARDTNASILYLGCLAEARRDNAFLTAYRDASPTLRSNPLVLWTVAIHGWNMGDLNGAHDAVSALIALRPEDLSAQLLKLEVLLRQDRSAELLEQLDQPLEDLPRARPGDRSRLTSLLAAFGYAKRASACAYRLFLENQDNKIAWMTIARLVFNDRNVMDPHLWEASAVGPDVAVNLTYDDGEKRFFVVEPDPFLRKLDDDSWEPEHPLVKSLAALTKGSTFTDAKGRTGVVSDLRHKFVARFHTILERYEDRFPGDFGFRSIRVDAESKDFPEQLKALLKERKDWFDEERNRYVSGPWPLSVTADRLGLDTMETAAGLAAEGVLLKVALGNEPERQAAFAAIRQNRRKGCVLDLQSFWQAWRMQTLDVIVSTCGAIHVCQSVLDRLRARRVALVSHRHGSQLSASYKDGQIVVSETPEEVVCASRDDLERAIEWLTVNAKVCPLVVAEDLPSAMREQLRDGTSSTWNDLVVAMQKGLLFVSDDLPTRQFGELIGHTSSCWSQAVLQVALRRNVIDKDQFVRLTTAFVRLGHNYIGVSGTDLAHALRLDVRDEGAPGSLFGILSGTIGGRLAEADSHAGAVLGFMYEVLRDSETKPHWKKGASLLLERLLRSRHHDYGEILLGILTISRRMPDINAFVRYWAVGHFIPDSAIFGGRKSDDAPRTRKRTRKRDGS